MAELENGTGTGDKLHVDKNNQAHTFSIVETEASDALSKGNSFNINTGWITITATTAALFFKNLEDNKYIVNTFVVAFKQGTVTNQPYIELIRNPTTGTIVDSAVNASQISNSDFGSPNQFNDETMIYKGASGETFTDGSVHGTLGAKLDGRGAYGVGIQLTKGSSVGVKVYPDLASGNVEVYVALIGYLKDSDNE